MLGFLKKKRNEDTKVIAEELGRLAALENLYYDVLCSITYHYELDEDNIKTIQRYDGSVNLYELYCFFKLDYEINGKKYHVESSIILNRSEILNNLYMSIERYLEDGSDISLKLKKEAVDIIKEELLSERAEQMKTYINNNKDIRLVMNVRVEK